MTNKLKSSWTNNVVSIYSEENLTHFEKILVIQALLPEHLHTALSKWAAQQLGISQVLKNHRFKSFNALSICFRSEESDTTFVDVEKSRGWQWKTTHFAASVAGCWSWTRTQVFGVESNRNSCRFHRSFFGPRSRSSGRSCFRISLQVRIWTKKKMKFWIFIQQTII